MAVSADRRDDVDAAPSGDGPECISIRGCRVHNLRNIDLDIPRDQLVVITGPSGSGKSSLAFDTIFAEGQRQYIESLSVYARQFLHQMERPDVDLVEGLEPTISIDQRAGSQNPRSTVATVTEVYDYLRLLYARLGEAHCYQCGRPISQQSPEQILDEILRMPEGTKVMVLAPLVRGRKGKHEDAFAAIRKAGFVRVRVDGVTSELDAHAELEPRKNHTIEAVVDRIVVRESARARLAESIRLGLRHGEGLVVVSELVDGVVADGTWQDRSFSIEYACPDCQISYDEIQPRTFSFNSPYGACPTCEGLGSRLAFDPDLLVPDASLSLARGAITPWRADAKTHRLETSPRHKRLLTDFAKSVGAKLTTPLAEWKPRARQALIGGAGDFPGLMTLLEDEYAALEDDAQRARLDSFRGQVVCPECHGARLRAEARSVLVAGRRIHELTAQPIDESRAFFASLEFAAEQQAIAAPVVREIAARLAFMQKVGLGYLTLDRSADTLSGGELQRVRLATGIGSGLVGVCYVLDEPTIGLHPRDNDRLIEAMRDLQRQGNSVLVVEHDESVMRAADTLIDIGPGAGAHGGTVVAAGSPAEVCADPASITGQYLSGALSIPVPAVRRKISKSRLLTLEGATTNNLKNVTVGFPLSALVCVTGVSGSGKSSLLNETLAKAVAREINGFGPKPGAFKKLRGVQQLDKFIEIDQSPIGRTPRSNPATYTGVFDEVRKVFAQTKEAKLRGYKTGRFSFNVKGGRCEECQGQGQQKIEMNFLPDLYVECPVCGGQRFNAQTLEVKYRDLSIADVLDLRVDDALAFFENFPAIRRLVESLQEVGLGYLTLGQSCTTLSGGEAQRIKLATELARVATGKTLYLLDEPTTGLHFDDVRKLLDVLGRLVDLGNTVIVIEHNLDVIKTADWVVDLGPEGGAAGGHVLATGTPEEIAALDDNATGRYLRAVLPSVS